MARSTLNHLQRNVFENFEHKFTPEYCGRYDMPVMRASHATGCSFIRFCDSNECLYPQNYIAHFYYDDFKFINAWRRPDSYIEQLKQFKAVISPDFSMYTDFPVMLQMLAHYRRQWCGAYWQHRGIDVIPDVVWGDERSYDFCFDGLPRHSTVAVSSVGVKRDAQWNGKENNLFERGYNEMLKRLELETVLFYGDVLAGLGGNIIKIPSFYAQRRGYLKTQK